MTETYLTKTFVNECMLMIIYCILIQIIQSKLKSGNLCSKKFLFENFNVAKSFPSRQKKPKKCKSVKMQQGP